MARSCGMPSASSASSWRTFCGSIGLSCEQSMAESFSRITSSFGKSPGETLCCQTMVCTSRGKLSMSSCCLSAWPHTVGISVRICSSSSACDFTSRARLLKSLIFCTEELRGNCSMCLYRSSCSRSNREAISSFCRDSSQNDPTYTRVTSGVSITLPNDHISAPLTRSSCCVVTRSALFKITCTLALLLARTATQRLSSSDTSSL
mmetsp:Transcript_31976/g.85611  ORF Transcript_31976/g.85611 Transcript_31976/m.85611 type:complete len:205 (+) Transcript_31976:121-735(+)